jgi:fibronectin type 3 domain-containing protein
LLAAPTGVIAQATSSSTITIEWVASASYYVIWSSTSSSGPFTTLGTSITPNYNVTGLSAGTTYCFRILAPNSAGNVMAPSGPPACATTPVISPPANVVAQAISSSSIEITWNSSSGAASYTIYRSGSQSGPFTTAAGTSPGASFTDQGRSAGTTYYYEVAASNSAGIASAPSSPAASATTLLAAPTGVTALATSQNSVTITWNQSSGAASYTVYRSTSQSGPFNTQAGTSTIASFTDQGRSAGTTYYYVVTASNSGGASAQSHPLASATTVPPAPTITNITALVSPSSIDQIKITWTTSTGATSYEVFRQDFGSTQWTSIGTTTVTSLTTIPTVAWYKVTASNSGGTSPASNIFAYTISVGPGR